jgi:hypothetical protein
MSPPGDAVSKRALGNGEMRSKPHELPSWITDLTLQDLDVVQRILF